MELTILFLVLIIIILISLSYWYSGTETALVNLEIIDIVDLNKNHKNYKYVIKLKENLDKALITILIMNNIINVLLSAIPVLITAKLFDNWGTAIMIGIITLIIIIFGDILPKSKAIINKKKIVLKNSKIVYYNILILKPLVNILIIFTKKINNSNIIKTTKKITLVDDKTIKDIANFSEEKGDIKPIERRFIHNILKFGDLKIKNVMVKKKDVYVLKDNYYISETRKIIKNCGYTRIPYIEDGKVLGIIYAKDILYSYKRKIKEILRKPFIVSENEEITNVLKSMKYNKIHLAIVYNKENDFIGIVTLEDILESIVGNIKDEYHLKKNK